MTRPRAIVRLHGGADVTRNRAGDGFVLARAYHWPRGRDLATSDGLALLHQTRLVPFGSGELARRRGRGRCRAEGFEVVREPDPNDGHVDEAPAALEAGE